MSTKLPNALSLRRFLLKQQTLKLYRDFVRLSKEIGDQKQRREFIEWIRSDFVANKHHDEEETIKMHLSRGSKALKQLANTVTFPRTASTK